MRRILWIVGAAALALPSIAMATSSSARSAAEKQCRTERTQMTSATFTATYATNKSKSNAFGKCVSHRTSQNTADENSAQTSAEAQCRSQQSADSTGFSTKYGTGKNGKNAFGKCVSQTAHSMSTKTETTQVSAEENAAKQCRSEQSSDAAAFKAKYGTGAQKANAFGRCVSQKARAQEQHTSS
ncbi:MAG TPA: hypothetical protein VKR21_02170 [Solirubrobacteraceae bacterium]|nr:hypothetical protein [Solirubrobacteraceae bacterium]